MTGRIRNNRKNILIRAAAAAAVCLLLSGCAAKKPQTAVMKLQSNPTTGYDWEVTQEPELFEITSEYITDAKDSEMAGAGGTQVYTLKPLQKGTAEVCFTYKRSWEEEADSVLSYTLKVSGDMQITVESSRASIAGDISELPSIPEFVIEQQK